MTFAMIVATPNASASTTTAEAATLDPIIYARDKWYRFRWRLALMISRVGWWVMPEPARSRCYSDFSDALNKIKAREGM